jgi:hypothetical protein
MTNDTPVQAEDVIPVRSRIHWGAIVAGSGLALAAALLLSLLGTAIGLSIDDRVTDRGLTTGAVIWAILVTAGALFLGGFIASQLTTGENKIEGMLYGLLVWALTFALLATVLTRISAFAFSNLIGVANAAPGESWQDSARRAGVPQQDIERAQANVPEAMQRARDVVANPDNRIMAAWSAFLGTLVSMIAAAIGGWLGAGPHLRLFTIRVDRTTAGAFDRRDAFVRT